MNNHHTLSIVSCKNYDSDTVKSKLYEAILAVDPLNWVKPGMKIAIKTNLVSAASPDKAVTSHPAVVSALTELLVNRGALVIIGDSPGGPFTAERIRSIYEKTGMVRVEQAGGLLNLNTSSTDIIFHEGKVLKTATFSSWLLEADAIIGVCKLKTHGMMRLSANVKNFFGTIPGTIKAEYHYRFPDYDDFADMLIDINEYLKPVLYITDAIIGMEGNGPTSGTPREIGALLVSKNPYLSDLVCAKLIGLDPVTVPTIKQAMNRFPDQCKYQPEFFYGNPQSFYISDFKNISNQRSITFSDFFPSFLIPITKSVLSDKPSVDKKSCIGCRRCLEICPAHAIVMKHEKPFIDRHICIRCFCCQEFCPKGAMIVKHPIFSRLIQH